MAPLRKSHLGCNPLAATARSVFPPPTRNSPPDRVVHDLDHAQPGCCQKVRNPLATKKCATLLGTFVPLYLPLSPWQRQAVMPPKSKQPARRRKVRNPLATQHCATHLPPKSAQPTCRRNVRNPLAAEKCATLRFCLGAAFGVGLWLRFCPGRCSHRSWSWSWFRSWHWRCPCS